MKPRATQTNPAATPNSEISVKAVEGEGELFQALAIREVVFIEEQGVPESLERDEEDSAAYHLLVSAGKHAVGTGRLVASPPPEGEPGNWGRVGRMAVVSSHRRNGLGTMLLSGLEGEARRRGYQGILLHAQTAVMEFYIRQGYRAQGPVFEEAGMPHVEMQKSL